jgi:serine protease Do
MGMISRYKLHSIYRSVGLTLCFVCLFFQPIQAEKFAASPLETSPEMIKRVQDSVVNIQTDRYFVLRYGFPPSFLAQFFYDYFENRYDAHRIQYQAEGSGILIESSGLILTNEHVIRDAENIRVIFNNRKEASATLIGKNRKEDLALLQIDEDGKFQAATLGDSDALQVSEVVYAIGTPYGYAQSVTRGIVSAVNREIKNGDKIIAANLIQTDVPINPGSSGGPLLNPKGEVVGIITKQDWRGNNIGFAIPISKIKKLLPELKNPEQQNSAIEQIKNRFGFIPAESKDAEGAAFISLSEISHPSQAGKAGLQNDDRLQKFREKRVADLEELIEEFQKVSPNERVYIEFARNKRTFFTYLEAAS